MGVATAMASLHRLAAALARAGDVAAVRAVVATELPAATGATAATLTLDGVAPAAPELDGDGRARLPLRAGDVVLGALTLELPGGARLSDGDREHLAGIAALCAHALQHARLHETERATRQRLERIAEQARRIDEVTERLSLPLSVEEIAEEVIVKGVAASGAATGGMWLLDETGQSVRMVRSFNYGSEGQQMFARLDLAAETPLTVAIRSARPVFVDSVSTYAARFPESQVRTQTVREPGEMTFACLPLGSRAPALGGLAFVFRDGRALDDDERRFLQMLAAHAAHAVERARAFAREQTLRAESEAARARSAMLDSVTRALIGADQPGEGLQRLADVLVPELADWCTIYVLAEGRIDVAALAHPDRERAESARRFLQQHPIPAELEWGVPAVLRSGESELLNDISDEKLQRVSGDAATLAQLRAAGITAHLTVPLEAHGQIIGALALAHTTRGRVFEPDDCALVEEVGTRVALTLGLQQQLEATRRARAEAEAARTRSELLAEATKLLAGSLDYETTLRRVAGLAVPAYADWCMVDLVDPDGQGFQRVAVAHADPADAALAQRLARGYPMRNPRISGVASVVAREEPMLLDHIDDEVLRAIARDDEHFACLQLMRTCSAVSVPLTARGRTLGALTLALKHRVYTADDLWLAQELAVRAALSIDNARLYRRATEAQERTAKLQAISAALAVAVTPDDAAAAVLREVLPALDAAAGCVLTLARDGTSLELLVHDGDLDDDTLGRLLRLPLDEDSPLAEAAREARVVWSGARAAWGAAPLVLEGRVRGVIALLCAHERALAVDEQSFLLATGRQCAQAIERARLYEAARQARAEAEAASGAKDEFLAMLGHELRNPLAPIVTALELMKRHGDGATERERVVIERQVTHMVRLVDDLLDVSRITRGKVDLKKEPIELFEVVQKAIEMASPLLEQRQHVLAVSVPPSGLLVAGDHVRLGQVVSNLVANAAKYTEPRGRIAIAAAPHGDEVELRVADSGIGIAPEMLPHVFDMFVQGRQSLERSQGGLGLGLAIVRALVQLHGGRVEARSAGVGRGSEFVVRLPALAGAALSVAATRAGALHDVRRSDAWRILIVDDNRDAADLLAESLSALGHQTLTAYDAPSALSDAAAFKPDVAVLDIGLPVMDGYELARRLRQLEGPGTRLIALTGYGQDADRRRTRDAGFDVHLVKPIDVDALIAAIASLPR